MVGPSAQNSVTRSLDSLKSVLALVPEWNPTEPGWCRWDLGLKAAEDITFLPFSVQDVQDVVIHVLQ